MIVYNQRHIINSLLSRIQENPLQKAKMVTNTEDILKETFNRL
jgi:hypothetical protein